MRCVRCDIAHPAPTRFCVRCGHLLADDEPQPGAVTPSERLGFDQAEIRLVHCHECDAPNAASRRFCGRCGAVLRPGQDGEATDPGRVVDALRHAHGLADPGTGATVREGGVPATLLVVTVLTALAIIGVALTILSARGVGLFAGPLEPEAPGEPVAVAVTQAAASSEVPPSGEVSYSAANLVDGDETTAWKEGVAGDGAGEWVELRLEGEVPVVRLLLWNGYQAPGRYREHNRVSLARIEVGDRAFTADLVDVEGPQAVDLPEPVLSDVVRFTILDAHAGRRYEDTALSRLEIYARPDGA